ncbi:MAG: hypothetical protein ACLSS9_05785 [Acutalibacteraceae bacterium]|nr:hypothetical protein [Clostridiales bacterium]
MQRDWMDFLTRKRSTPSVKMAYTALLNPALLVCEGRVDWCAPEENRTHDSAGCIR